MSGVHPAHEIHSVLATVMFDESQVGQLRQAFAPAEFVHVQPWDADGIAIHAYWHPYTKEIPAKCDDAKLKTPNYLGMECIKRVRTLLKNRARNIHGIGKMPIWVTEDGLHSGTEEQEADPDNIRLAMERQYRPSLGVVMVNWYDLHSLNLAASWQTYIVNRNGDECLRWSADNSTCVFSPAVTIRNWAKSKGFPVTDAWLPPAPGMVPCSNEDPAAFTTWSPVDVECDMHAPPPPQ